MEVLDELKQWFAIEYPGIETDITNFRSFEVETTNYNSYIYFFDITQDLAKSSSIPKHLVLKLAASNEGQFPDFMRNEFHNLEVLQQYQLHTPKPVYLIENLMGDNRLSIMMERMKGVTLTRIIREQLRSEDEIGKIIIECNVILKKIHQLPPSDGLRFNDPDVEDLRELLNNLQNQAIFKNYTAVDWMYDWLKSNLQEIKPLSNAVNHGDFQADNILVDENHKISIVDLDWMYRFGYRDIRFDLAWSYIVNYGLIGDKWANNFLETYTWENDLKLDEVEYFVVLLQYLISVISNTREKGLPYPEDKRKKFQNNGISMRKNIQEIMLKITGIDMNKV